MQNNKSLPSLMALMSSTDKILLVLFVFILSVMVFFVNPYIDEVTPGLSHPLLKLQLAFSTERALEILSGWGADGLKRYFQVIWIDYVFALSYGIFFYRYIKLLVPDRPIFYSLPVVDMLLNWSETSIEIIWCLNPGHILQNLFFIHSVLALLKWLVVIVYLYIMLVLTWRYVRSKPTKTAV